MDVRQLLEAVKKDEIDIDTAVNKLKDLPYEDLVYANIDHHRELRNGFPEVIYCEGKTDEHIIGIVDVLLKKQSNVLGTRCRKETAEKLKEISRELRYLSDNVLILTREREVLAAKTKLHDQMGAGLTAIRQSLAQENADYSNAVRLLRQAVNAIWNDNQYPLEEGEFERFLQDARTIGVKVRCTGSLPKEEEYAHIYILAMRECLTNGVCHAGATELFITMQEDKDCYHICITNNGEVPEKEVVPKGGLYNLSRHIFDYSGEMHIQSMPYFALTITFQKKELDHEEGIDCRGSEDAS